MSEPSVEFPVLVEHDGNLVHGHAEICALNFKATYCSCGADLTNDQYPLYELP